jgi:hypothetical protein
MPEPQPPTDPQESAAPTGSNGGCWALSVVGLMCGLLLTLLASLLMWQDASYSTATHTPGCMTGTGMGLLIGIGILLPSLIGIVTCKSAERAKLGQPTIDKADPQASNPKFGE